MVFADPNTQFQYLLYIQTWPEMNEGLSIFPHECFVLTVWRKSTGLTLDLEDAHENGPKGNSWKLSE